MQEQDSIEDLLGHEVNEGSLDGEAKSQEPASGSEQRSQSTERTPLQIVPKPDQEEKPSTPPEQTSPTKADMHTLSNFRRNANEMMRGFVPSARERKMIIGALSEHRKFAGGKSMRNAIKELHNSGKISEFKAKKLGRMFRYLK